MRKFKNKSENGENGENSAFIIRHGEPVKKTDIKFREKERKRKKSIYNVRIQSKSLVGVENKVIIFKMADKRMPI
jgi:hypothetical protein